MNDGICRTAVAALFAGLICSGGFVAGEAAGNATRTQRVRPPSFAAPRTAAGSFRLSPLGTGKRLTGILRGIAQALRGIQPADGSSVRSHPSASIGGDIPSSSVEFRRFINAVLERAKTEGQIYEWRNPRGVFFREVVIQKLVEHGAARGLSRVIKVLDEEFSGDFKRKVRFTEPFHGGSERRAVVHETNGDGGGLLTNPRLAGEFTWWRSQIENGRK